MKNDALTVRPAPPPPAPSDIDEALIEMLVRTFYARVREDEFIGPFFRDRLGPNWEPHLIKLCAFWSSVALRTGRYKGTPMQAHMALDGLIPQHFAHWLSLFRETARDVCPPVAAVFFIDRAERIAQSLQAALWFRAEY